MNDILERLKLCAASSTDTDLAKKIGVSQQSITSARTKKRVPSSWLITASQLFNVSIDWLYYGTGSMRPGAPTPAPQQAVEQPTLPAKAAGLCPRYDRIEAKLEKELAKERERWHNTHEILVESLQRNLKLSEENGQLRLENLILTQHIDAARQMCKEYAAKLDGAEPSLFVDPKNTFSSDPL